MAPLYQFCQLSIRRGASRAFEVRDVAVIPFAASASGHTRADVVPHTLPLPPVGFLFRELASQIRPFRGIESHPAKGSLIPVSFRLPVCPSLSSSLPVLLLLSFLFLYLFFLPIFSPLFVRLPFYQTSSFLGGVASPLGESLHAQEAIATECSFRRRGETGARGVSLMIPPLYVTIFLLDYNLPFSFFLRTSVSRGSCYVKKVSVHSG